MKPSTLCYLIRDGQWLMLLRNKKKNDINAGKWIGVGGKIEPGETPREGMRREIYEETGLHVSHLDYRGIIYFIYEKKDAEKIWTYTANDFDGNPTECNEGTLAWIPAKDVLNLELWDGDRIFLEKLLKNDMTPFCLELHYDENGRLLKAEERKAEAE